MRRTLRTAGIVAGLLALALRATTASWAHDPNTAEGRTESGRDQHDARSATWIQASPHR